MPKIRTFHVFHTECLYSRGGEKYLYELLTRMSKRYTITLYIHRINVYWRRRYEESNIRTQLLWTPRRFYWLVLPYTIWRNVGVLRKQIRNNDVIFATNFPVNLMGVLVSDKTLCHCFEPIAIFYDHLRIKSLPTFSRICVTVARLCYSWLDKYAVRNCAILTTLNTSVTPHILATYGKQPDAYIRNGVDCDFFSPSPAKRKKSQITLLGHSTDYTIFKGTEQLFEILRELKQMTTNFRVIITESIHDQSMFQKYTDTIARYGLTKYVSFAGNLTENRMKQFYRTIDYYIYTGSPHSAGGSTASLSVLESQACGTPVIRSVGNDDEIIHPETGYYIDPDNPAAAAHTIFRVITFSQPKRASMRAAARKHVVEKHSWDVASKTLERIIQKLKT